MGDLLYSIWMLSPVAITLIVLAWLSALVGMVVARFGPSLPSGGRVRSSRELPQKDGVDPAPAEAAVVELDRYREAS